MVSSRQGTRLTLQLYRYFILQRFNKYYPSIVRRSTELNRAIPPTHRLNGSSGEKGFKKQHYFYYILTYTGLCVVKVYREGEYFCFISDFQEDNIRVQGKVTKLLRVFVNFALLSESM